MDKNSRTKSSEEEGIPGVVSLQYFHQKSERWNLKKKGFGTARDCVVPCDVAMKMMAFQMMKLKGKELLTWKRSSILTNIMLILLLLWREKVSIILIQTLNPLM